MRVVVAKEPNTTYTLSNTIAITPIENTHDKPYARAVKPKSPIAA
jgi:hypothetical protein